MGRIAFFGLGALGLPIASRLATKLNVPLVVFDPDQGACQRMADCVPQIEIADSIEEAVAGADLVCACLPNATASRSLFQSVSEQTAQGQIWLDFSTHDVDTAKTLSQLAKRVDAIFIETPVIGGLSEAGNGTLYALVSSVHLSDGAGLPEQAYAVLNTVASEIRLCGMPGQASAMKALQNGLGLMQLVAIAETIAACDCVGVDPQEFSDFVSEAPGMANSSLFRRVASKMLAPDPDFSARLSIAAKDMQIAHNLMQQNSARIEMAGLATALFDEAISFGLATADFTRIAEVFLRDRRSSRSVGENE